MDLLYFWYPITIMPSVKGAPIQASVTIFSTRAKMPPEDSCSFSVRYTHAIPLGSSFNFTPLAQVCNLCFTTNIYCLGLYPTDKKPSSIQASVTIFATHAKMPPEDWSSFSMCYTYAIPPGSSFNFTP